MSTTPNILKKHSKLLDPIIRAYELRLNQFGNDARGVFWQNKEYQFKRFENLSRIFEKENNSQGVVIHDFGCGYGALFDFLVDKPIMTNSHYIGTDMSRQMIIAARQNINDPRAEFRHQLIAVDGADYTIVSGTYNMHLGQDEEEWEAYIKYSLKQLWSKTRVGLAFNMLRDNTQHIYDGLFYINGHNLFDFCVTHLSPNVEIQDDGPLLPDWTFYIHKE